MSDMDYEEEGDPQNDDGNVEPYEIGQVFHLPEDAEIHASRIVLQNSEITSTGDERMVDSFQQHNVNKIRILRICSAVGNFLDKLSSYGSDTPSSKISLSQSVRAPFNRTTMEMTSWRLSRDKIEVEKIPKELIDLVGAVEDNKTMPRSPPALPIRSATIPILAFASAPILPNNCHLLKKNLAGLTLKPTDELLKADFAARKELLKHLKTYLGISTSTILLSSIKQISDTKKSHSNSPVILEIENIKSFLEDGVLSPFLSTVATALKEAAFRRKKLRDYTLQGLEPIQVQIALKDGPLFQEDLYDKEAVLNASSLAHPVTSGPLRRAKLNHRPRKFYHNNQDRRSEPQRPQNNHGVKDSRSSHKPNDRQSFRNNRRGNHQQKSRKYIPRNNDGKRQKQSSGEQRSTK